MSQSIQVLDITREAETNLSASQYRFVTVGSTAGTVKICGTTDTPLGVLQNAPTAGQAASIRVLGTSKVVANGAFSEGDFLAVAAADGEVDTASGASLYMVGIALEGATKAGIIAEVLLGWGNGAVDVGVDDTTIEVNSDNLRVKDGGITAAKCAAAVTYKQALQDVVRGDLTAAPATVDLGFAVAAGTISRAGFSLQNTGADGTDALGLEMDVLINGTSIFTTKPKLLATAADGADTFTAGTGVTVGVIDATKDDVVAGDNIRVAWTLTRTTPEDEMDSLCGQVDVAYKVGA